MGLGRASTVSVHRTCRSQHRRDKAIQTCEVNKSNKLLTFMPTLHIHTNVCSTLLYSSHDLHFPKRICAAIWHVLCWCAENPTKTNYWIMLTIYRSLLLRKFTVSNLKPFCLPSIFSQTSSCLSRGGWRGLRVCGCGYSLCLCVAVCFCVHLFMRVSCQTTEEQHVTGIPIR